VEHPLNPASGPAVPIARIEAGDLTTDLDLTPQELGAVLDLAARVKRDPRAYRRALSGQYLTLLFEKPSLRTRLTFELAIKQLGGDCVVVTGPIAEREPLKDVARNLDRWTQGIVARTFLQETIDGLADWASVPVVNALSDMFHPCQALADMQTMQERFGELAGRKLAFVGDGNNVAHSLMLCCARLGVHFAIATPRGYEPHANISAQSAELAAGNGAGITVTHDPREAVEGADAIYTDVWASMGQEDESSKRRKAFQPYQVTEDLLAAAKPATIFMHCLPAKRGQEVTDEVCESTNSAIFDQAENRLHAQKALLLMLLSPDAA
jgi:ornithine carbamoyltransferase